MKVRRRDFTLLEVLVVIALLGLFLGLVGININKAVHQQRFESEVAIVVDTLRTAQFLMLILDVDIHVQFLQGPSEIQLNLRTNCPLTGNWGKILLAPKILRTIHIVNFRDHLQGSDSEKGKVDLRFLSSGYVMSNGVVRLATADQVGETKGLDSYINLPGYPTAIVSTSIRPPDKNPNSTDQFANSMTHLIVEEIQAIEAAKKQKVENEQKETEDDSAKST